MNQQIAPPTSSDSAFDALHAAGWSIGDVGRPGGLSVSGHRGDQKIEAHGRTQSEAWRRAFEQAESMPSFVVASSNAGE